MNDDRLIDATRGLLVRALRSGWRDRGSLRLDICALCVVLASIWGYRAIDEASRPNALLLLMPAVGVIMAIANSLDAWRSIGTEDDAIGWKQACEKAASDRISGRSVRIVLVFVTINLAFVAILSILGRSAEGVAFPFSTLASTAYFGLTALTFYLNACAPPPPDATPRRRVAEPLVAPAR